MSVSTKIYLYHQRHQVVMFNNTGEDFSRRYNQVYTKNLIANKGTTNQILIEFVNQDQKPQDLTGLDFTFRLISTNEKLLLEKKLEIVNVTRGQMKIVLTENELESLTSGTEYFSIERENIIEGIDEPVFVDDNSGARGQIDIVDSLMPKFNSSKKLSILEVNENDLLIEGVDIVGDPINTNGSYVTTFQIPMTTFSADLLFEGSLDNTSNLWYTISNTNYVEATELTHHTIEGFHPFIRMTVKDHTFGELGEIFYR